MSKNGGIINLMRAQRQKAETTIRSMARRRGTSYAVWAHLHPYLNEKQVEITDIQQSLANWCLCRRREDRGSGPLPRRRDRHR